MKDEKQAALAAIQQINAVDGFDPSPLAVEYADLNTHESAFACRLWDNSRGSGSSIRKAVSLSR